MSGKIITLEGVCCAGKTTLLRKLAESLKAGTVPELPEYARQLLKPFKDKDAILYNEHRAIDVEKIRMLCAIGLSKIADCVILDRSFLSRLSLAYGAIDMIGVNAYCDLASEVLSAMRSEELPMPDKVLYISVNTDTVQDRNAIRSPQLDAYWVKPDRITRQNEFYQALVNITAIELIQGDRKREEVLADCIASSCRTTRSSSTQDVMLAIEDFNRYVSQKYS